MSEDVEIQHISDDFLSGAKEEKREKPIFKTVVDATITDVSDVKYNPANGEGENKKDGRKFKKMYFTVTFLYNENGQPKETFESYGFRFYEDNKTVWFGSDKSACGKLVNTIKKYTPNLSENPSVVELKNSLVDRKVKLITEEYGVSKTKKTTIESFV